MCIVGQATDNSKTTERCRRVIVKNFWCVINENKKGFNFKIIETLGVKVGATGIEPVTPCL
jgi:hypothetical protein